MSSTRRVARRSAMKRSTADKENVAADDNCPADSKRYTNLKMKEEVKEEGSQQETAVKVEAKKAKARKRVGFVSSQPTEVLTFEKDEAPEINLASIVSRSSSRTAARVPISPIAPKARKGDTMIVEEVLEWDEDDDEAGGMSCFSLHDLQGEVKITRDTEQMSLAELRRELQGRRKSTAGTKSELIQRLNRALKRAKDVEVMDD